MCPWNAHHKPCRYSSSQKPNAAGAHSRSTCVSAGAWCQALPAIQVKAACLALGEKVDRMAIARDCTCQLAAALADLLCCTSMALPKPEAQASSMLSGMTFWRSHDACPSPIWISNTTILVPLLLSSTAAYTCKECQPFHKTHNTLLGHTPHITLGTADC